MDVTSGVRSAFLPTVRGRLRNRPARDIVDEVNGLVAKGFEEVVLTGIHIGHYKNRTSEPQVKNLALADPPVAGRDRCETLAYLIDRTANRSR